MPILAATDVAKSVAFYTEALGWIKAFAMSGKDGNEVFAIVSMNDGVMFGLSAAPAEGPRGTGVVLMCYVEAETDIDAYYAECRSRGTAISQEIKDEYWGDRCFTVNDPDGYVVCVCKTVRQLEPDEIAAAASVRN